MQLWNVPFLLCTLFLLTFGHHFNEHSLRIVGGYQADVRQFPFYVKIIIDEIFTCGGAIIFSNTVITAAHCCEPMGRYSNRVRSYDAVKWRNIFRCQKHEEFNLSTMENDIALVTVKKNWGFNKKFWPAPLPNEHFRFRVGDVGVAIGFGKTDYQSEAQSLQAVDLPIIKREECQFNYRIKSVIIDYRMFCAGFRNKTGVDTCVGDSGGPYLMNGTLIGITSYGIRCGSPKFPGVYVNISPFRQWIFDFANRFLYHKEYFDNTRIEIYDKIKYLPPVFTKNGILKAKT